MIYGMRLLYIIGLWPRSARIPINDPISARPPEPADSSGEDPNSARFRLICGSLPKSVLCSAATGECELTLKEHSGAVWSACFSPDGAKIVSASSYSTVRVWRALMPGQAAKAAAPKIAFSVIELTVYICRSPLVALPSTTTCLSVYRRVILCVQAHFYRIFKSINLSDRELKFFTTLRRPGRSFRLSRSRLSSRLPQALLWSAHVDPSCPQPLAPSPCSTQTRHAHSIHTPTR